MELITLYRKLRKKNSGGFTLVEVIASIAILGIVVVSLLPLFPQILGWSKTTEDQLVTGNLLSQVVFDLKNDAELGPFNTGDLSLDASKYDYLINNITYKPKVKLTQTNQERDLNLFRAQIKIGNKDTYVYLKDQGAEQ